MVNSSFAFWKFLEYFFPNIFYLPLVEFKDTEPTDTEGWLYVNMWIFLWLAWIGEDRRGLRELWGGGGGRGTQVWSWAPQPEQQFGTGAKTDSEPYCRGLLRDIPTVTYELCDLRQAIQTSLNLSFPICKMGVIMLSTLLVCCEN